jgi:rfaE bifunctional protein kinase chain/domain
MLKKKNIATDYLITEESVQTPVKIRILAGDRATKSQQILRIDHESRIPKTSSLHKKIEKNVKKIQMHIQALLISDYNYQSVTKGVYDAVLPSFQSKNIPVTLDSRYRILDYKGATTATPNLAEAEAALNQKIDGNSPDLKEAGKALRSKMKLTSLLLTQGSSGMTLFEKRKAPLSIPIFGTADIVDVAGAGDTVISVFTLALACGASFKEAAFLANYAGGIVVMKKGTGVVTPQELKLAIISEQ